LLEKHLRIKSEYSSEYFDFIENLIWKIRPSYALGYLNLPADYTTGGEDVDIDKTAKYYIRKAMAKCDALACNSAHDVEGAFKTMVESADFDTYVNDFEVDIVIK